MRGSALFPWLCSIVAFVLGILCLFSGHKDGYLEDYDIIRLNTSTLGHDLVPTSTSSSSSATSTSNSISSFFSNLEHNVTVSLENDLGDIENDIADKLAEELGIQQWYSMHLMTLCEGMYKPNATARNARLNITHCTNQTAMYHFDIQTVLNQQLSIGKYDLNLSDLGWSDDIQNGIDSLNAAMDATFVLYCIGIGSAGVAILGSFIAVLGSGSRLVSFGNWGLTGISFVAYLISSVIVTVFQIQVAGIVHKYGNDIGLFLNRGTKFLIITWVATGCMFIACLAWVFEFFAGRRNMRKRLEAEKACPPVDWSRCRF